MRAAQTAAAAAGPHRHLRRTAPIAPSDTSHRTSDEARGQQGKEEGRSANGHIV